MKSFQNMGTYLRMLEINDLQEIRTYIKGGAGGLKVN